MNNLETARAALTERALFVGDSITANWNTASANRNTGMPGKGSALIGQRFAAEIRAGRPRYVHILAGTNDDPRNPAPTLANIDSMILAARVRHIPVIVGTLPPLDAALFPQAPYIPTFNAALIANVAPYRRVVVADYYSAMITPTGVQNSTLFMDGIHPNDAGYIVMNKVLAEAESKLPKRRNHAAGGPVRHARDLARHKRKVGQ